jgi:hypothetical protein
MMASIFFISGAPHNLVEGGQIISKCRGQWILLKLRGNQPAKQAGMIKK